MGALVERGMILINYGNVTFIYDSEFNPCMKVEGVVLEDVLDNLFYIEFGKLF